MMPVIPADHWSDQGDGTAWALLTDLADYCKAGEFPELLDRTCDVCGGFRSVQGDVDGVSMALRCPTCNGDGRHRFEVEVAALNALGDDCAEPVSRRCVSVVPGMVLRVHAGSPNRTDAIWDRGDGTFWYVVDSGDPLEPPVGLPCHLPPAAAPGMWAVELTVHT